MVIRLHGAVHKALPPPPDARRNAAQALRWLEQRLAVKGWERDVLDLAAEIHALMTRAHPFIDGNGRVARALSSWVLVRAGYRLRANPRVFCRDRTEAYYQALAACDVTTENECPTWTAFFAAMVASAFESPPACLGRSSSGNGIGPNPRQTHRVAQRQAGIMTICPGHRPVGRSGGIVVELTHQLPDARLYYTIDGSDATRMSIPYRGEFLLTFPDREPVTVAAIAVVRAYTDSAVVRHVYFPQQAVAADVAVTP